MVNPASSLKSHSDEVDKALLILTKRLTKSLLAIYLHGSAVAGGLRPRSDVDLLAVVDQPLSPEMRQNLADDLMTVSGRYPFDPEGRRPLELIVFLRADLNGSRYPARCEFIYGEWLRQDYEAGKISQAIDDPDLTLVLAQAQQQAIPLIGPDASDLLPVIAQTDIHRAIKDALPALIASLNGDERNVLLTLARMWRTCATGDFVSKDIAANWAAARLPTKQAAVLAHARESYLNGGEEDWASHHTELQLTVSTLQKFILYGNDYRN